MANQHDVIEVTLQANYLSLPNEIDKKGIPVCYTRRYHVPQGLRMKVYNIMKYQLKAECDLHKNTYKFESEADIMLAIEKIAHIIV